MGSRHDCARLPAHEGCVWSVTGLRKPPYAHSVNRRPIRIPPQGRPLPRWSRQRPPGAACYCSPCCSGVTARYANADSTCLSLVTRGHAEALREDHVLAVIGRAARLGGSRGDRGGVDCELAVPEHCLGERDEFLRGPEVHRAAADLAQDHIAELRAPEGRYAPVRIPGAEAIGHGGASPPGGRSSRRCCGRRRSRLPLGFDAGDVAALERRPVEARPQPRMRSAASSGTAPWTTGNLTRPDHRQPLAAKPDHSRAPSCAPRRRRSPRALDAGRHRQAGADVPGLSPPRWQTFRVAKP